MVQVNEKYWTQLPPSWTGGNAAWRDEEGIILSIQSSKSIHENLRQIWHDADKVHEHFRSLFADEGMGLLECQTDAGLPYITAIAKECIQGQPTTYFGQFVVLTEDTEIVFALWFREIGENGARERGVGDLVQGEGKENVFDADNEWASDAHKCLPTFKGPNGRHMSDNRKFDERFAFHALTLLRKRLDGLLETVSLR